MSEKLDCGHEPTPTSGGGTGYGVDPSTGKKYCYPCSETREREAIRTAENFTGYISSDKKRFTTWTGGELAEVTEYRLGKERYTPTGGSFRLRHVTVRTPDGAMWFGWGSDAMDVINIHRKK